MWSLGYGLLPVAAWLVFLVGSVVSPALGESPVSLPPPLGQKLAAALSRAQAAATAFGGLREEITHGSDVAATIVEGLGPEEVSLLNGSTPACELLSARFQASQLKSQALSRMLSNENQTDLVQNASGLDENQTDLVRNASGLTEELDALSHDLDEHFARIRELALSQLSSDARKRLAAGVAARVGSSSAHGNSGKDAITDPSGNGEKDGITEASGALRSVVDGLQALLTKLNKVARQIAERGDSSMLAEARRLGARLARLQAQKSGGAEESDALEEVTLAALARAEHLLKAPRAAESGSAGSGLEGTGSTTGFNWKPGTACTSDDVTAAGVVFDGLLKKFRGPILRAMLPPEVENLHRVVHALEVMKNSLLAEVSGSDTGAAPATSCEQYFRGVGQMEADLGHYKGLIEKKKKRRRKQKHGKLGALTTGHAESGGEKKPRGARSRPALSALGF